jgi:hypothetical protein
MGEGSIMRNRKIGIAVAGGAVVALALGASAGAGVFSGGGQSKACAATEAWWHSKGAPSFNALTLDISVINSSEPIALPLAYQELDKDVKNVPVFPWAQVGKKGPAVTFGLEWVAVTMAANGGVQIPGSPMIQEVPAQLSSLRADARACGFSV